MVLAAMVVVGGLLGVNNHVRTVEARWGGPPLRVAIADRDLSVGEELDDITYRRLPADAVPAEAVTEVAPDAVLSLPLPRGAVVTRRHLDPRGPAAGLPAGMRAVPVPTEAGWDVHQGGWVDVWTLGAGDRPARLVAASRPVLQVRQDPAGLTSLVGLTGDEVEAVTTGLALGRVLLAHAPPPEHG
jgi:Flp pilus assembly protein CpaB